MPKLLCLTSAAMLLSFFSCSTSPTDQLKHHHILELKDGGLILNLNGTAYEFDHKAEKFRELNEY
ncbi:MAG: hypothetical protein MRY83_11495 [Flavobacteriales bacterium]|nr:hypothetical protein [Flavobacteriales bacterium]